MRDAQLLSLKYTKDRGYAAAIFLLDGKFRVVCQYMGLTKFIKLADFEKRADAEQLQKEMLAQQERYANDPD